MFDDRISRRTIVASDHSCAARKTNMRTEIVKRLVVRTRFVPQWFWEILIAATLMPPILHTIAALDAAPAAAAELAPAELAPASGVFDRNEPLEVQIYADLRGLCRDPERKNCADLPATLVVSGQGVEKSVQVLLHVRGRFRSTTGGCDLPALFVLFGADTAGTPFAGEKMLPLTTHCRTAAQYEQYVVKEYLAYRIYNALTDKSLRARLAHVTYHDASHPGRPLVRFAFFTEHFDSLARREDASVFKPAQFDLAQADATELATLDLFEYMIGNTDWSAVFRHNVVLIRDAAGRPTAVPYDFDFSGLVDAEYAVVAPQLPIHAVTQRLFRGACRPDTEWERVFAAFEAQRDAIDALLDEQPLERATHDKAARYLTGFYEVIGSAERREREIVGACRRPVEHRAASAE
jgi:hypothetical protein